MAETTLLIDEIIKAFHYNKQLIYDPTNDSFIPSLESRANPYSVQCLIDWIYNIQNNKIIKLDFDKIEKDLQELKEKYGNKCKGLFYPNWKPFKYTYEFDTYKAKHYDRSIYEINKQNIKNIYMKLFGDTESIIHYILYNKSFLFKLLQPDVDHKKPKLDHIKKINGKSLFKLNMKQSIYILRLLLFKYTIIEPNALFEDHCTIIYDIENRLREMIVTYGIVDNEIKELYLDLICDVQSISTNDQQKAFINIFSRNNYENGKKEWYHINFFDNDSTLEYNHDPTKISFNIMKELLFRGIPPFQICNSKHIHDYEVDKYQDLSIIEQSHLFNECLDETIDRDIWSLTTTTMPFITCNLAKSAKIKMYLILDKYLKDIMTQDCIRSILDFIYIDWSALLPEIAQYNIMKIQAGMFLNYMIEFNLEEMDEKERNELFDKQFLTKSMSDFLFNELRYDEQLTLLIYEVLGLKVFYKLAKLERFSTKMLKDLAKMVIFGDHMDEEIRNIFVDIVSIHIFDEKTLKDESFMNDYRNKTIDCIACIDFGEYYGKYTKQIEFVDGIITNTIPDDFLQNNQSLV